MNILYELPNEILVHICQYLDYPTLFGSLAKTCHKLHDFIAENPAILRRYVDGVPLKKVRSLADDVVGLVVRGEEEVLPDIRFPKLRVLTIIGCSIEVTVKLINSSPKLRTLRLRNVEGFLTCSNIIQTLIVENSVVVLKNVFPELMTLIVKNSTVQKPLNCTHHPKFEMLQNFGYDSEDEEIATCDITALVKNIQLYPKLKRVRTRNITPLENGLLTDRDIRVSYKFMVPFHHTCFVNDNFSEYSYKDDGKKLDYTYMRNVSLRTVAYLSDIGKLKKCQFCQLNSGNSMHRPYDVPNLRHLEMVGPFFATTIMHFLCTFPRLTVLRLKSYDPFSLSRIGCTRRINLILNNSNSILNLNRLSEQFPNLITLNIFDVTSIESLEPVYLPSLRILKIVRCQKLNIRSKLHFPRLLKCKPQCLVRRVEWREQD